MDFTVRIPKVFASVNAHKLSHIESSELLVGESATGGDFPYYVINI